MAKVTLLRTEHAQPTESDLERARHFIFGVVDGLGRDDRRAWRRWWRHVMKLVPGELLEFETKFPRNSRHHRLFMAMLNAVYDAQERFTDFEQFRYWTLLQAGHVEWVAGARGGVVPIAKSISFAAADEEQFSTVHAKVLDFLHGADCAPYLWPHLDPMKAHDMMTAVLDGFEQA